MHDLYVGPATSGCIVLHYIVRTVYESTELPINLVIIIIIITQSRSAHIQHIGPICNRMRILTCLQSW